MPKIRVGKRTIKLPYGRKGGRRGKAGGYMPKIRRKRR